MQDPTWPQVALAALNVAQVLVLAYLAMRAKGIANSVDGLLQNKVESARAEGVRSGRKGKGKTEVETE